MKPEELKNAEELKNNPRFPPQFICLRNGKAGGYERAYRLTDGTLWCEITYDAKQHIRELIKVDDVEFAGTLALVMRNLANYSNSIDDGDMFDNIELIATWLRNLANYCKSAGL